MKQIPMDSATLAAHLDSATLAAHLGSTPQQVNRWRYRAVKRLEERLAELKFIRCAVEFSL